MSVQKERGASPIGFFLIFPWIVGLALLAAFSGGSFETVLIFAVVGVLAMVASLYAYSVNIRPFNWLGRFDKSDVMYIAIGIVGLFASVAFVTSAIPGNEGIIAALIAGGAVLAFVLLKSHNILVPIVAHAVYNFVVLLMASGAVGSAVPFAQTPLTPTFEFGAITSQDTFQQFLLQLIVGSSEELLKVATALGIYVLVARSVAMAWALSVGAWAALHSVQAYVVQFNIGG